MTSNQEIIQTLQAVLDDGNIPPSQAEPIRLGIQQLRNNHYYPTTQSHSPPQDEALGHLAAAAQALSALAEANGSKAESKKIVKFGPFDGNKRSHAATQEFILQAENAYSFLKYSDDEKIRAAIYNFSPHSQANAWVGPFQPHLNRPVGERPVWLQSWAGFSAELYNRFGDIESVATARFNLRGLRQKGSTASYVNDFNSLAARADFGNDDVLKDYFIDGLKDSVRESMVNMVEKLANLFDAQAVAIRIDDNQYKTRSKNKSSQSSSSPPAKRFSGSQMPFPTARPHHPQPPIQSQPQVVSMDLDSTRQVRSGLSEAERKYRNDNKLCYYCGARGPFSRVCPNRPRGGNQNLQATASNVVTDPLVEEEVEQHFPEAQAEGESA